MSSVYDYAVIGAGVTGLSAAYSLKNRFSTGVIIDGGPFGGVIQSRQRDGFTLELGPNTLALTPELDELLTDLKLSDRARFPAVKRIKHFIHVGGRMQRVPRGPASLAATGLLNPLEKISAIAGLFKRVDARALDGSSVSQLFTLLFGKRAAVRIAGTALRGIFGGDIELLSAAAVFPRLYAHLEQGGTFFRYMRELAGKRRVIHLSGGNDIIIKALASSISEVTNIRSNVSSVAKDGRDLFTIFLESGERIATRRCIVTTSGPATARYIGEIDPALPPVLDLVRRAPISVVHAAVRPEALPRNAFGILFSRESGARAIGVLFNSLMFPDTAPPGRALVTLCFGGVELLGKPLPGAPDFVDYAKQDLKKFLRIDSPEILSVHTWAHAIPQYEASFAAVQEALNRAQSAHPGIYFIGSDRGGLGVPERIRWGTTVISHLLRTPPLRV